MSKSRPMVFVLTGLAVATVYAATSPSGAQPPPAAAPTISIGTRGSELAYDHTTFTARAGQMVTLTFSNRADPDSRLQHNWVLVKPGTESEVAAASTQAGPAQGYVPSSPNVIAHTHLLKPGSSETVRFRAPREPGKYPYFCTFPGHSGLLKGELLVIP